MEIDPTWRFLRDFFEEDPLSIVELINRALGIHLKKKVQGDNFGDLSISIQPLNVNFDKPYLEFLRYVHPEDEKIENDKSLQESQITNNLENLFINHFWNIFSQEKYVGAKEIPIELAPYLIIYALEVKRDWFLYYDISGSYFIDDKDYFDEFIANLKKKVASWKRPYRFYSKLRNIISLFCKKKPSPEQLFPLMTLFIILRREWEYSNEPGYIKLKKASLRGKIPEAIINDALIFSLYNQYKDADESIKQEIEQQSKSNSIPPIKIHPLVEEHIIGSKSYNFLFCGDSTKEVDYYKYIEEEKLGKECSEKRLLVDYLFPWTQIRENDVFVPPKDDSLASLKSRIYLSLCKGRNYEKYLWKPEKGKLFDYIQIEPTKNSSGDVVDKRVQDYRDYLKPEGTFLFVRSKNEDIITNRINRAFSDFRHDLGKGIMSNSSIKILQKNLGTLMEWVQGVNNTLQDVELFLNNPMDLHHIDVARASIKALENDLEITNVITNDLYFKNIHDIRDLIEDYSYSNSTESLNKIPGLVKDVKQIITSVLISNMSNIKERIDDIDDSHDSLCSYIDMAGIEIVKKKDFFQITDFLNKYIKKTTFNKNASLDLECSSIDPQRTVNYNKALLRVMLDSIIDNACKHGFQNYDCKDPHIRLILNENDDYLILKICNNGRPIEITNNDYKTRGVFKGTTGHTGLGGYLVSKYAQQLGGYIEIPQEKEWNTEIHLYIKK